MIELKDVYKTYERKGVAHEALKGVSLKVEKGDIFGVIGFSGAGKSTLIRLVNYLERPTKGKVFVDGKDLSTFKTNELRAMKKNIGMVFQHFNLLESKTVFDNIAIPLVLAKKGKKEIRHRVEELLEFVGLSDKAKNYPNELSGGQKQRVGIARALASNPSILLCDEATSALDPETTDSILQLLKKINQEYNITIMIITHEMSVIKEICNRVAVMEKGKIIEQGSVLEVFGKPKHPTTKNFVKTVMNNTIPDHILKNLTLNQNEKLIKLSFIGQNSGEPVIHDLIQHYGVKLNIVYATMNEIQETILGSLYLKIEGDRDSIKNGIHYLEKQGIDVEEIQVGNGSLALEGRQ